MERQTSGCSYFAIFAGITTIKFLMEGQGRRFCSTHDVKEPSCKISNSDMDHFSLLGQEQIALALLLFTLGKNVIFRWFDMIWAAKSFFILYFRDFNIKWSLNLNSVVEKKELGETLEIVVVVVVVRGSLPWIVLRKTALIKWY